VKRPQLSVCLRFKGVVSSSVIVRLRQEYPQLPLIMGGDALYCHEPFMAQLRVLRLHHVLVCKPTSHAELYACGEDMER
jgi:hypothetical protein